MLKDILLNIILSVAIALILFWILLGCPGSAKGMSLHPVQAVLAGRGMFRSEFDFDDGLLFQSTEILLECLLHFTLMIIRFYSLQNLLERERGRSLSVKKLNNMETEVCSNNSTYLPYLEAQRLSFEDRKEFPFPKIA